MFKALVQKNEFLSLAGNVLFAGFGFLSFLLLARTLSQNIFGQWMLFVSMSSFIEMFRFGLTRTAMVRFLSGANLEERKKLIGSNWVISASVTIVLALLIFLINLFAYKTIQASGFGLFFTWYPIASLATLPLNNALTLLQADLKFGKILFIRILNMAPWVIFLILNLFFFKLEVQYVIITFIFASLISSLTATVLGWNGLSNFFNFDKYNLNRIIQFGKYSVGTLIGSNVLKSADTFIIGLSPILGPEGVAMYSIPLKLTELMDIPLRSLAATVFPKMSKAYIQEQKEQVLSLFYKYTSLLTMLLIPFAIINLIFAEYIVFIIGGEAYLESANIYRLFCIYGLILPLDRFTGIGLDAINQPKYNMYKVAFMVSANIIGDIIAVFVFNSLFLVALTTIAMTIVGILMGNFYFRKTIPFHYRTLATVGFQHIKTILKKKI